MIDMKKIYSLAVAAALFGASQASAATFPVVFNGTDNTGWTAGDNAKVENGHLAVTMTESNGKWRQDLSYTASDEAADYTVNAATMKLLAIKFIGARPQGNMTLEIQYRTDDNKTAWMNTKWKNRPDGSMMTTGGNNVYYYDLTKDELWTGEISISKINFKIADNTQDPHSYTLDWINVFASKEAIEADWKDDGDSDADEANVAEQPVMIGTKGYATLADAWAAAADGDVILVNEDQTISGSRLTIGEASLTVKAGKEGVKIVRAVPANALTFLVNQNKNVTFEGLTFDGNNTEATACFFEASNGGKIEFKDCKVMNFTTTNGQGIVCAKNSGKVSLAGIEFENNTVNEGRGEVFVGSNGSAISGNNKVSIYLEKQLSIAAGELTNTEAVTLYVDADRALMQTVTVTEGEGDSATEKEVEQKSILVSNCKDASKFKVATAGFALEADEALNALVLAKGGSAVAEIDGVDENAPVEYYNLQGMKVSGELTPGIYVRRQGTKAVKVLVK